MDLHYQTVISQNKLSKSSHYANTRRYFYLSSNYCHTMCQRLPHLLQYLPYFIEMVWLIFSPGIVLMINSAGGIYFSFLYQCLNISHFTLKRSTIFSNTLLSMLWNYNQLKSIFNVNSNRWMIILLIQIKLILFLFHWTWIKQLKLFQNKTLCTMNLIRLL